MKLTDTKIRNAKPGNRDRKLTDGGGLYLLLKATGGRLWRFDYRFGGRRKTLALGRYPRVSLKQARIAWLEAKDQLEAGVDPGAVRRAEKLAQADGGDTLEAVAADWIEQKARAWTPQTTQRARRLVKRHLVPWLGQVPVGEITAPQLLQALRRVESRGTYETAARVYQTAGQIMRYAVATGKAERDPTGDLRGALTIPKKRHFAALTEPARVGQLLRSIWAYDGTPVVRAALQLSAYTFQRPGEIRTMHWADVDTEAAEWRFTASKTGQPHIVPLSRQVLEILEGLHPLTGRGDYVLPSARGGGRPLSENGARIALRAMGYTADQMTVHGFRAMARTLLDEVLGFRPDFIEQQLAHAVRDPLGRAYNRTSHLEARRAMMHSWADYLDSLRDGGKVVGIGATRHRVGS